MEFLDLTLRPDWQQVRWQRALHHIRRWRFIKIAVIVTALASTLWVLWRTPTQAEWDLLQILVGPVVLGSLVIRYVFQTQQRDLRALLIGTALLIVEAVVAYGTQPAIVQTLIKEPWGSLLTLGSVALPIVNGVALTRLIHADGHIWHRLGLNFDEWKLDLLMGLAFGGALGFHLLLTMSNAIYPPNFSLSTIYGGVWGFCYYLGFYTLIEELLFRGLAYRLRFETNGHAFWWTTLNIVLLNVFIHVGPILQKAPSLEVGLGWLGYRIILASMNLFLFVKRRSLLPPVVTGVIFNLLVMLAWQ